MKNVLIGFILAILIIIVGHFYYHIPQGSGRGWLFGGAAIAWAGFSFGPKLWKKLFGGTLNDRAK